MKKKAEKNLGFARRLAERLRQMGYWPEGRPLPNYTKFGVDHGFVPSAVYRWLHGEIPRADTFYQLCIKTQEQAHWYLLGRRVPEPTPGMSIPDYLSLLQKDLRARAKQEQAKARRRPTPIRGGSANDQLPAVDLARGLQGEKYQGLRPLCLRRGIMSSGGPTLQLVRERKPCTYLSWARPLHPYALAA